ncbi:MAG: hypothetical protein JWP69_2255 [Flaviaesturariibacter sp.]|nr:hypothetical protein [Flaviaesturariibacter sp.]
MKRIALLLVLAVAGTGSLLSQIVIYDQAYPQSSRTENMFNRPKPGTLRNNFNFYLHNGNRLSIELSYIEQLQSLTNLDSLLKQVWRTLQPFSDSFNKPLVSRRIDYYQNAVDTRLRFLEYPQTGNLFRIKGTDTAQLKMEQDTLRISLLTKREMTSNKKKIYVDQLYFVTLYLNNITDLSSIQGSDLEWALTTLKADLGRNLYNSSRNSYYNRFAATYNVVTQKKLGAPIGELKGYTRRTRFTPYTQVGIQYARGAWTPSVGVGFEVVRDVYTNQKQHFILLWEPYFFFRNNAAAGGKVTMDRNDFITFKYKYNMFSSTNTKELNFATNVSLGYLVNRNGDWFERHTFKFTLPGLQAKNIMLEPEFYFNDFFRHFSPSLKLTLVFE